MKNKFLLVAISLLLISFSSCSDNIGDYHPKKKISRIFSDYGYGKTLQEMWSWNKNQLVKIEHSSDWTEYFTYNKKGQIVRVDDYEYGEYVEYQYDGNKLKKIRYYNDNTLEEEYSVTYDGNHPTKIELTYYVGYKGKSRLKSEGTNPLKTLLSGNVYQRIERKFNEYSAASKSDGYTYIIKLEWEKGNISKVIYEEIEDGEHNIEEVTFKYDNKSNPFHNCLSLYLDDFVDENWGSKNNVVEEFWTGTSVTYSYIYDGNYPIEQRSNNGYFKYYEYE